MQYDKDLVVLSPDKDTKFFLDGVLSRASDMGLRAPNYQIDIHLLRDAGCMSDAAEFLGTQANRYAHALVMVAHPERSGHHEMRPQDMEASIEADLQASGWGDERARAIVVDPGIEGWLLKYELHEPWPEASARGTTNLKRAAEDALRRRRKAKSPELYRSLGKHIVDAIERDRALRKLFGTFAGWFSNTSFEDMSQSKPALQARFDALVEAWLRGVGATSSFSEMISHPAYRSIIAMGPDVIPLILRDLEREPKPWGPALQELTGAQPVPKEHAGRLRKIKEDWLRWARENGYAW